MVSNHGWWRLYAVIIVVLVVIGLLVWVALQPASFD